jgi:hypothetical protein
MTDGLMILDPSDRVMFLKPDDHFHARTAYPDETRRQSKAARDAALAGASAPGHLARLKAALAAGDATAFEDAAHALEALTQADARSRQNVAAC